MNARASIGRSRQNGEPVLVVGGSLSGLAFALACAWRGVPTLVLERTPAADRGGGGLGVDLPLLASVVGHDPHDAADGARLPVISSYRDATSWIALHDWLRDQTLREPLIELVEGLHVSEVREEGSQLIAKGEKGGEYAGRALVGADGYRSLVRRTVNPGAPLAKYAGYLLWRGLVSERELSEAGPRAINEQGLGLIDAAGYRLIAYPVPGRDGSTRPGERQISFAWYDASRDDLLREKGCLSDDGFVMSTLPSDRIPASVGVELRNIAETSWPEPWRAAVVHACNSGTLFGTPIAEYWPEHLAQGRFAIIGDAAHVVSPMTGRGFTTALEDADSLAAELSSAGPGGAGALVAALDAFEALRLPLAQDLARSSMRWSSQYVHLAHRRTRTVQA